MRKDSAFVFLSHTAFMRNAASQKTKEGESRCFVENARRRKNHCEIRVNLNTATRSLFHHQLWIYSHVTPIVNLKQTYCVCTEAISHGVSGISDFYRHSLKMINRIMMKPNAKIYSPQERKACYVRHKPGSFVWWEIFLMNCCVAKFSLLSDMGAFINNWSSNLATVILETVSVLTANRKELLSHKLYG